jgi:O-antigen ligase
MRATSYNIIEVFPILGSGAGTYPFLHAKYKDPILGTGRKWKHAHNEYIEFFSNHGFLGFSIFCGSIFLLLLKILKGIHTRHDPLRQGILFGTFFGINSVLFHAFVDLHFHIPSIAIYFFVLLALGIIASNKHYT